MPSSLRVLSVVKGRRVHLNLNKSMIHKIGILFVKKKKKTITGFFIWLFAEILIIKKQSVSFLSSLIGQKMPIGCPGIVSYKDTP